MNEQRRIRQQLAQLGRDRQRLAHRNRDLRDHYRQRASQRLAGVKSILAAGLLGAGSYYLASRWSANNGTQQNKFASNEARTVILELLNHQCDKWTRRFLSSLERDRRSFVESRPISKARPGGGV